MVWYIRICHIIFCFCTCLATDESKNHFALESIFPLWLLANLGFRTSCLCFEIVLQRLPFLFARWTTWGWNEQLVNIIHRHSGNFNDTYRTIFSLLHCIFQSNYSLSETIVFAQTKRRSNSYSRI